MRPAPLFIAALIASGSLLALPANAKEGVRAKLDAPVDLRTAPGRTITVRWRLADAAGHPFGAGGIYLLVHRCGRRSLRFDSTEGATGGRYSARVRFPRGRIRKIVVGLEGWRTFQGRTERADAYFPFDPPLARRCRS